MTTRSFLIAGNWKMNSNREQALSLLSALKNAQGDFSAVEIAVLPPFLYIPLAKEVLETSAIRLGAQNLSAYSEGAYTGEISANMLADYKCRYVLVGHSERRQYFAENNELLLLKCKQAFAAGLTPILCVGESLTEFESGQTLAVIEQQLAILRHLSQAELTELIIAYEPVWAIGTGKTASPAQAQKVHSTIREFVAKLDPAISAGLRILYGGSVKPDNAQALFSMPDIDGGLIGGASLKAQDFIEICQAAKQVTQCNL